MFTRYRNQHAHQDLLGPANPGRREAIKKGVLGGFGAAACQSARNGDPESACNRDPLVGLDGERPTGWSWSGMRSPLGGAFRALRDNEPYAISRGINRVKFQLLVFALSGWFTGIAGAFYAGTFKVIGPSILSLPLTLFIISMMVVGGLGRPWGPILGCALLMLADESLSNYPEWRMIGLGVLTVLFIVFLPRGLSGAIESIFSRRNSNGHPSELGAIKLN